jgi:hypothetical protein
MASFRIRRNLPSRVAEALGEPIETGIVSLSRFPAHRPPPTAHRLPLFRFPASRLPLPASSRIP